TSEHLDYHKDVYEYVEAKRNLLRFQTASDFAILNKDYPASRESDTEIKGKVFWVSREGIAEGCFVRGKKIIVRGAEVAHKNFLVPHSQTARHANSENFVGSLRTKDIEIIGIKDILLPGAHNLENVRAAVMAATLAGVSKRNIVSVLKTFKGLPHRLELVREVGGVRYYDDSFSTTPETAIAAIQAFKNPEILILGGSSKGSDFTELGRIISETKNIKTIIGIGVEWPKIKLKITKACRFAIKNEKLKIIEGLKDMRSIVRKAKELTEAGDVVLLSPACASFDMFKNYKDRGEQFKKEALVL
ncbi:MAG: UDP-N-acetylmuramoyl-L-alanine--D-glutamate ligase, partial [Candidatus Levybacteria bacterium]|nr:UDP-N-acetylmuramoyl-L-alanine--D-glutamate ligase [Candidatus Levybacteria bacterium]